MEQEGGNFLRRRMEEMGGDGRRMYRYMQRSISLPRIHNTD
jgi:hypothetical protein